jgi:hypothetical protein
MTSLWLYFYPCTFHAIVGHFAPCGADIPDGISNVERYPELPDGLLIFTINLSLYDIICGLNAEF